MIDGQRYDTAGTAADSGAAADSGTAADSGAAADTGNVTDTGASSSRSTPVAASSASPAGASARACSPLSGLRVGLGFDVHAFAEGRKLILGGVDVPHVRGLLGHSDADVLAHAVADALLGAVRAGDIGKLFPDTDPAFEGADSLKLLAAVAALVCEQGYEILDVDCVIAAQAPKLSPYRDAMRENLSAAMGVSVDAVGVKATTTEHLGFEGREEGISARAVCLVARCC